MTPLGPLLRRVASQRRPIVAATTRDATLLIHLLETTLTAAPLSRPATRLGTDSVAV